MPPLATILLAAGASSRMGRPKLLLPWHDTTVIGRLISLWQTVGASQIAVVHRPDDGPLSAELDRLGFPRHDRIVNPRPEDGMFSSIRCAARWNGWDPAISHWAIALGDQPQLAVATLRALLDGAAQYPSNLCQPTSGGKNGHPVILPRDVFGDLKQTGAATLKDFLKPFSGRTVYCPVTDPGLLLDMDTPEDYKRIHSRK